MENVRDIFSMLHDATIENWKDDRGLLRLKIGCEYLAEKINPTFEYFYVDLFETSRLAFVPWMNPKELEQEYFIKLEDIFQTKLDILSAEIANDLVKVICYQRDNSFDYCGGDLYIYCKDIKIYDHNKSELTISRLEQICKEYWNNFGRK